jgi:hypothetical protein
MNSQKNSYHQNQMKKFPKLFPPKPKPNPKPNGKPAKKKGAWADDACANETARGCGAPLRRLRLAHTRLTDLGARSLALAVRAARVAVALSPWILSAASWTNRSRSP